MPQTVVAPSNLGTVPTDTSGVQRAAPIAVAGAGAGGSPPAPVMAVDSSDLRGSLTFGSGTVPPGGVVVTVTFVTPRDANRACVIMLQESTSAAAGIDFYVALVSSGSQITGFQIGTNTRNLTASQANTTYGVNWLLID